MGAVDLLRRLVVQPAEKRATMVQLLEGTVRASDRHSGRQSRNPAAAETIDRTAGYVAICAYRVAKDVANVRLRLYRPAKSGGTAGRRVSKSVRSKMLDGRMGRKASERAQDAGDFVEVTNHPLLDLLSRPNAYQSGAAFRELLELHKQCGGQAFILPVEGGVIPDELHLLQPQYVRVVPGDDDLIGGYRYGRDSTAVQDFAPDEVWQIKHGESLFDPYNGWSPVRSIIAEADIYQAINEWQRNTFENNLRPDSLISVEGTLSPADKEATEGWLESMFRGSWNAGKSLLLGGGKVDVKPLSWPPKDMGDFEIQEREARTILAALGVPESEVWMNDANLASSRTGNVQYKRDTIMPLAEREADEFTNRLLVEAGWEDWWFAPDDIVPEDLDGVATRNATLVGAGILTMNDARRELSLDPYAAEIGDVPRVNGTSVSALDDAAMVSPFGFAPAMPSEPVPVVPDEPAIDEVAQAEQDIQVSEDLVLNGAQIQAALSIVRAVALGEMPRDAGIGQLQVLFNLSAEQAEQIMGSAGTDTPTTPNPKPPNAEPVKSCDHEHGVEVSQRALWMDAAAKLVGKAAPDDPSPFRDDEPETVTIYRVLRQQFDARRDAILAATEAKPFGLDKGVGGAVVGKDATDDLLRRLLQAWGVAGGSQGFADEVNANAGEAIERLLRAGALAGLERVRQMGGIEAIDEGEALDRPEALRYFEGQRSQFIANMTEVDNTTATALETTLRQGLEEGETLRELQGRIREAFDGEVSDRRAAMIARTETAEAQVQGTRAGYAATRVVKGYRFRLAPNACEFCLAADKQYGNAVVELDRPLYPKGSAIRGTDGGTLKLDFKDTIVPIHPNCRCDIEPVLRTDP
jgi:HK97 family phage portal protein